MKRPESARGAERMPVRYGRRPWLVALSLTAAVGAALALPQARPTLVGVVGGPHPPLTETPRGMETLFRADLGAEIGIGCANSAGTAGGPNDFALGVTASVAPPFYIVSATYNVFSQGSPNLNGLSFVAWADSAGAPGLELGRQSGMPFAAGNNTAAITPMIPVRASPSFFFGLSQPQSDAALRIGVDTDAAGAGRSLLRSPACGANTFFDLTALGFPGSWVMAAVVDDSIPVELTALAIE